MGYFFTTSPEPENAVPVFAPSTGLRRGKPGKSWVPPKTHTPGSRLEKRGARFYFPEVGRWVSRDPIWENGGMNVYMFVDNDSVDFFDFLGLATCACPAISGWDNAGQVSSGKKTLCLYFPHNSKDPTSSFILALGEDCKSTGPLPPPPPSPHPPPSPPDDPDSPLDECVKAYAKTLPEESAKCIKGCLPKLTDGIYEYTKCILKCPGAVATDVAKKIACCRFYAKDFPPRNHPPKAGTMTECEFGHCECLMGIPWMGVTAGFGPLKCDCALKMCYGNARGKM